MAYRDYYSSGGASTSAPRRKKKKQEYGGDGGILGAITGGIRKVLGPGIDDAFGVGNLARMGWNFLPGIYNLGKGTVTDPGKTWNQAGEAIAGSFLSTADTLTGGLLDEQLESLAGKPGEGARAPGQDISPLWDRESGFLPGAVEDILNVATVAAPFAAGAKAAQTGAITQAARAAELGDVAGQTAALARAAQAGVKAAKYNKVAHPFRTMWRSTVRPAAEAAVDTKLAAAGASKTAAAQAADSAASVADEGEIPQTATQGPDAGESPQTASEPKLMNGDDLEALKAQRDQIAESARKMGNTSDLKGAGGGGGVDPNTLPLYRAVVKRIQTLESEASTVKTPLEEAMAEAAAAEAAKTVDPRAANQQRLAGFEGEETVSLYRGEPAEVAGSARGYQWSDRPEYVRGFAGESGNVYKVDVPKSVDDAAVAAAERARQAGEVVTPGTRVLDAEWADASYVEPKGGIIDTPEEATLRAERLSRDGTGDTVSEAQDPETFAQQAAENTVESQKETTLVDKLTELRSGSDGKRGAFKRFLVGSKTPGDQQLPLRTRVLSGIGERLIAADIRHEINLQSRYATAARAIALQSEPVKASVNVARDFVQEFADDTHHASRIVGDEITARLNGVRAYADAHGIPDSVAAAMGWRNEVIPQGLLDDPARLADFNTAIDAATELWRTERKAALDDLLSGRLGNKGLENIGTDSPILTKSEKKAFDRAARDLAQAEKMTGAIEREVLRAEKRVAGLNDLAGNLASKIARARDAKQAVVEAFDRSRSGLPAIWKEARNAERWNARLADLFARVTDMNAEFRGWTYDPHADALIEGVTPKGRYVVSLLPGVEGIPLAELTPDHIAKTAQAYQELFDGNADMMLGAWEEDGLVYIEPSQLVKTRSEAMVLGQSRAQLAVWDFGAFDSIPTNFGRPDIHGQFAGSRIVNGKAVSNHVFRDRYATQLYENAEKTKGITPQGADAAMALKDAHAVAWGKAEGKHPDLYFENLRVAFGKKQPKTAVGKLFQTLLDHPEPKADLFEQARRAGVDIETARRWYYRSHDAVEKQFRGKTVTLLNGHRIDAADLVYELLAVSSVSAAPLDNLASALTGVANMLEFNQAFKGNLAGVKALIDEFEEMGSGRTSSASGRGPALRTESELFDRLASGTHQMYNGPRYHAFEILSGHTINPYDGWDGWTTEYLRSQPEQFGGTPKGLTEAKVTEADVAYFMDKFDVDAERARELAIREYHGSKALAKILSFHDNLASPDTSMAVTLDSWMSRLFGDANWLNAGVYRHYADTMRSLAEELSEVYGETIRPHEVQAVFWAYAKEEISRQNVGVLHGYGVRALDMLENGTWTKADDPMLEFFELEAGPLREAEALKGPNREYLALRKQLARSAARKGIEGEKEVEAFILKNKRVQELKAEVRRIKDEGGTRRITRRKVETIRTQGTIDDARALAPEVEDQLHVPNAKKKDVIQDILGRAERYQDTVQEDIAEALRQRNPQEAARILSGELNQRASRIRDESWGDFQEMLDGNAGGDRLPAALERLRPADGSSIFDELTARMRGEVLGSTTLATSPAEKIIVTLYRNADFTTLVHEHAHVLRQMLPEADLRALGESYGIKYSKGNWTWTREAEERFANDFTGYLASGKAPLQNMAGVFTRLRDELLMRWFYVADAFQWNRMGAAVPDGTKDIINRYLNPDVSELSSTPGFELPPAKKAVTERLLAQEASKAPTIPGATGKGMYRSGVQGGRAIERYLEVGRREAELQRRLEQVRRTQDEIKASIIEGTLPAQLRQSALRKRANLTLERTLDSVDNPSLTRVPAQWQPLWKATQDIIELMKDNPEAQAQFSELPQTFSQMLAKAEELGIDPAHVRSFEPKDVHRLTFQMMRLGKGGEKIGNEIAAGTRYARNYRGSRATSIESLVSAGLEVTHEARTNAVVDMIESRVARRLDPGEALPESWVWWEPRKNAIRYDVDVATGQTSAPNPDGGLIIPKTADDVLRKYSSDFNHNSFAWLGKITNPWRAMVLTLAPRWYVNNIFGNIMLATAEGVRLQDWTRAWNAMKRDESGYRFAEVPQVTRSSFVSDLDGRESVIPRDRGKAGWKQAAKEGGALGTAKHAQHAFTRVNEVVDEFARAAVYFRTVRKGGTPEQALNRAIEAMVDYHSLSPFEQNVVRSVIPFYAWQKGMLKMGLRLPFDHPLAASAAFWLDRFNQQVQQEEFGTQLPSAYQNVVMVPGVGPVNLRAMNPLADSDALLTPQGIMRSMNPFLKLGVKAGLNKPDFGEEKIGIGPTGMIEEQVDVGKALSAQITTLPQAQVAGQGTYPSYGIASDVGKFFGVPRMSDEQLEKILKRTKEARRTASGPNPYIFQSVSSGRKKKKKKSTGTAGITWKRTASGGISLSSG